jgi:hypothetical protein
VRGQVLVLVLVLVWVRGLGRVPVLVLVLVRLPRLAVSRLPLLCVPNCCLFVTAAAESKKNGKKPTKSRKEVCEEDLAWIADIIENRPLLSDPFVDRHAVVAKAKRFLAVDSIMEDEKAEIAQVCSMLGTTGSARTQLAAYLRGKYIDRHAPDTAEGTAFKDWLKENNKVAKSESTARRSLIFFTMCRKKPGLLGIDGAHHFVTEKIDSPALACGPWTPFRDYHGDANTRGNTANRTQARHWLGTVPRNAHLRSQPAVLVVVPGVLYIAQAFAWCSQVSTSGPRCCASWHFVSDHPARLAGLRRGERGRPARYQRAKELRS